MQLCIGGHGLHLGLKVAWQLRCRADGAFLEELKGQHLSFTYGHPGISTADGSPLRQGWGVGPLSHLPAYTGQCARLEMQRKYPQVQSPESTAAPQIEWDSLPKELQLDDHEVGSKCWDNLEGDAA